MHSRSTFAAMLVALGALHGAPIPTRAQTTTPTLTIPTGIAGGALGIAFSPDGAWLAATVAKSAPGEIVLWAVDEGEGESVEIRRWESPAIQGPVAFSPDGRWIVTTVDPGSRNYASGVTVWDPGRTEPVHHWDAPNVFAFLPDGRLLVGIADEAEGMAAIDLESGRETPFDGHPGWFGDRSTDGRRALWAGDLYDLETGEVLRHFESTRVLFHEAQVLPNGTDALSPDGRIVATTRRGEAEGATFEIHLMDAESGRLLRRIETDVGEITDLVFSADGETLTVGHRAGGGATPAIVLEVATGREVRRVGDHAMILAVSPDERHLAASSWYEAGLGLWNLATGEQLLDLRRRTVRTRIDGSTPGSLVAVSDSGSVFTWDLTSGAEPRIAHFSECSGRWVWPTSDARHALVCGSLWDLGTVEEMFPGPSEPRRLLELEGGFAVLETETLRTYRIDPALPGRSDEVVLPAEDDAILAVWASSSQGRIAVHYQRANFAPRFTGLWDTSRGGWIHQFPPNDVEPKEGTSGYRSNVAEFAFSPSGALGLRTYQNRVWYLWDGLSGEDLMSFWTWCQRHNVRAFDPVCSVEWSDDERFVVVHGLLIDVAARRPVALEALPGETDDVLVECVSADGAWVVGVQSGRRRVWNPGTGRLRPGADLGHTAACGTLTSDGSGMWVESRRGTLQLWALVGGGMELEIAVFPNGDWAVVDDEGRYDASRGGGIDGIYWVAGTEPIGLEQLKERYYEPGLLAKTLGFHDEPLRDVTGLAGIDLHPDVQTDLIDGRLTIELTDRGGGIGRVPVWLNGKQVTDDARAAGQEPAAGVLRIAMDLSDHPYLVPGSDNVVEVRASNAAEYLMSRGVKKIHRVGSAGAEPPTLHAVVVGVSDYAGEALDLRFSAKDAVDMANALRLGAGNLFGAERTRIHLLTTDGGQGTAPPTKANVRSAFETVAAEASSTDIVVIYFAGHGVNHGGVEGDYYYLTSEASSGELDDVAVRQARAVSSTELTEWIAEIAATKQVLILDTCGAGRVVDLLSDGRDITSSQRRALDRMKDRMGLFVLAGSAADAVSYEASRFGQGLLTYSLLQGMRGAALREERFVDVAALFNHAVDAVPRLAQDIGGIQRPLLATPGGQSFDIGEMDRADWAAIELEAPKPFVVRSNFQDEDRFEDHLALGRLVNERLRDLSARGTGGGLVFVDASDASDAYRAIGRYRIVGAALQVTVRLLHDGTVVGEQVVEGDPADPGSVAEGIAAWLDSVLATSGAP